MAGGGAAELTICSGAQESAAQKFMGQCALFAGGALSCLAMHVFEAGNRFFVDVRQGKAIQGRFGGPAAAEVRKGKSKGRGFGLQKEEDST